MGGGGSSGGAVGGGGLLILQLSRVLSLLSYGTNGSVIGNMS